MKKSRSGTASRFYSSHSTLAALGMKLRSLKIFDLISEKAHVRQKTIRHTPVEKLRERFARWVLDVCRRPFDQDWLNYQHEIGLRHTHLKKNLTDGAQAPPQVPLRYLIAFTAVVNDTIKPFLAKKGNGGEEVEAMHRAWSKAVLLTVILWSRAYVAESDW